MWILSSEEAYDMDSYDAFRDYEHRVGRWWMLTGFALLLAVPTAICVHAAHCP